LITLVDQIILVLVLVLVDHHHLHHHQAHQMGQVLDGKKLKVVLVQNVQQTKQRSIIKIMVVVIQKVIVMIRP